MAQVDREYHRLMHEIKRLGYSYEDPNRKDVLRLELPSHTFRHEFKERFPIISTKEINFNNIIVELLWFMKGDTNIKYLLTHRCNIWNKDAYKHYCKMNEKKEATMSMLTFLNTIKKYDMAQLENWFDGYTLGDLGPVYGRQWRNSNGVDQLKNLVEGLIKKPLGTEHIVNSWNPADIPSMALPPCHYSFQVLVQPMDIIKRIKIAWDKNKGLYDEEIENFSVRTGNTPKAEDKMSILDQMNVPKYEFELHWDQRSVDTFLGLPYNIASYAALAMILSKFTGYEAIAIQGDLKKIHLYHNSLDAVIEQTQNDPYKFDGCDLVFPEDENNPNGFDFNLRMGYLRNDLTFDDFINEMKPEWFALEGYESYPAINVSMLEKD